MHTETQEEFLRRLRTLQDAGSEARGPGNAEPLGEYQRTLLTELRRTRARIDREVDVMEAGAHTLRNQRHRLAELEYLVGETDTVPGSEPRTLVAGELCQKHIGLTVSSFTYRNARKSTNPSAGKETYTIDNFTHQNNGVIVIRRGLCLRSTTLLTVVEP